MFTRSDPRRLAERLLREGLLDRVDPTRLERLPQKGIAHEHLLVHGLSLAAAPVLLRVPRISQFGLPPAENLAYQAACFRRAAPSGVTPRLHHVFEPDEALPMGALVIEAVPGGPVSLPRDLDAIAECLAAAHRLPVPAPADRPPLADHADPVAGIMRFIEAQAPFVDEVAGDAGVRAAIAEELSWARGFRDRVATDAETGEDGGPLDPAGHPVRLVLTDTHPGNYLVDDDGVARFVDLEKALYGSPAVDVAHACLHTSTNWDIAVSADLTNADLARFHARYLTALGPSLAGALRPWLLPMRRLTWLRTTTWACKFAATGGVDPEAPNLDPEDRRLLSHIQRRLSAFVDPEVVDRVRSEWSGGDWAAAPENASQ